MSGALAPSGGWTPSSLVMVDYSILEFYRFFSPAFITPSSPVGSSYAEPFSFPHNYSCPGPSPVHFSLSMLVTSIVKPDRCPSVPYSSEMPSFASTVQVQTLTLMNLVFAMLSPAGKSIRILVYFVCTIPRLQVPKRIFISKRWISYQPSCQ